MSFIIEAYRKKNMCNLWDKFANVSATFSLSSVQCTIDENGTPKSTYNNPEATISDPEGAHFHNYLTFMPCAAENPSGTPHITHAEFMLKLDELEDVNALVNFFVRIGDTITAMDNRALDAERVRIEVTGKKYTFSTTILDSDFVGATFGKSGEATIIRKEHSQAMLNYFDFGIVANGEVFPAGGFSLWGATKSAKMIAYDAKILRALLDGQPEDVIEAMATDRPTYHHFKLDYEAMTAVAMAEDLDQQ